MPLSPRSESLCAWRPNCVRAAPTAGRRGCAARGRPLPRMRVARRAPAPCRLVPGGRRRPRLRHGARARTARRCARSSPRTSSVPPARASARSRCSSGRLRPAQRGPPAGRRGEAPALRNGLGARERRRAPGAPRTHWPEDRGARSGARRGSRPPGSLQPRGTRSPSSTTGPRRAGLARFAIAPYRLERDPLPAERKCSSGSGSSSGSTPRSARPRPFVRSKPDYDALVLAVGLGDADVRYPGDEPRASGRRSRSSRSWSPAGSRPSGSRRRDRRRQHAVDVAREALRLGAESAIVVYRRSEAEMPAIRTRSTRRARRVSSSACRAGAPPRRRLRRGSECREMRLGEPDEAAAAAPSRSKARVPPLGRHRRARDRAAAAVGACPDRRRRARGRPSRGRSEDRANRQSQVLRRGDVMGGATVVEAVRGAKPVARALEVPS